MSSQCLKPSEDSEAYNAAVRCVIGALSVPISNAVSSVLSLTHIRNVVRPDRSSVRTRLGCNPTRLIIEPVTGFFLRSLRNTAEITYSRKRLSDVRVKQETKAANILDPIQY